MNFKSKIIHNDLFRIVNMFININIKLFIKSIKIKEIIRNKNNKLKNNIKYPFSFYILTEKNKNIELIFFIRLRN